MMVDHPSYEDLSALAKRAVEHLKRKQYRLMTAESCTGGLISALITGIAGASQVFDRGIIAYSNEAKEEMLNIPKQLMIEHGAVSEEVVRLMAENALAQVPTATHSLAASGVSGPTGGTIEKPVGLVWLALVGRDGSLVERELRLGDLSRQAIHNITAQAALGMVTGLGKDSE